MKTSLPLAGIFFALIPKILIQLTDLQQQLLPKAGYIQKQKTI